MADKAVEKTTEVAEVEEVEKDKKVVDDKAVVEEDSKTEAEEAKENGKAEKEDSKEANGDSTETEDKCCIKRKSTGGDKKDDAPAEGATPEKKPKLDEPAEAESNGEAEVAA